MFLNFLQHTEDGLTLTQAQDIYFYTHHSNRKAAFVTACHAIFYSESMAGWETS